MEKWFDILNKNPQIVLLLSSIISVITTIIINWINAALKAKNERMNYITRVQFDIELKIYQDLSEKSFEAVESCALLFPPELTFEPQDTHEKQKYHTQIYEISAQKTNLFKESVYKNSPFIKQEFAIMFEDLLQNIITQNNIFYSKLNYPNYKASIIERSLCTKDIISTHRQIINTLRNYLNSLKIE